MLKRSMEERGENWQHTLEFVRFKISVETFPRMRRISTSTATRQKRKHSIQEKSWSPHQLRRPRTSQQSSRQKTIGLQENQSFWISHHLQKVMFQVSLYPLVGPTLNQNLTMSQMTKKLVTATPQAPGKPHQHKMWSLKTAVERFQLQLKLKKRLKV